MLNKEVFLLEAEERDGDFIVFAPLKGMVLKTDGNGAKLAKKILQDGNTNFDDLLKIFPAVNRDQLLDLTIDKDCRVSEIGDKIRPDSVTLLPTFDCNLRCGYCYASGGENPDFLDWGIAKASIDFVIKNALLLGREKCYLEFHGGGEPTFYWKLMVDSAQYFKRKANEQNILPIIKLVSNGFWSMKQLDWVSRNVQVLCISFDGPRDIQNIQRPTRNGTGDSFDTVFRSAKAMWKMKKPCVIRITVTDHSVKRVPEIIKFFIDNFPGFSLDLEPLHVCGRSGPEGWDAPSAENFVENYILADRIARTAGTRLFFSGFNLVKLRRAFCRVASPNFIITPTGTITSCYEAAREEHQFSNLFHYGKYDPYLKEFWFDWEKIRCLQGYGLEKTDLNCKECFCQYHCAGNCLIKKLNPATLSCEANTSRCKMTKEIGAYQLSQVLANS